jgi:hypothetical protein
MMPMMTMVSIFVSIAAIAAIMSSGTRGVALPHPQHCDKLGWPSCYTAPPPDRLIQELAVRVVTAQTFVMDGMLERVIIRN